MNWFKQFLFKSKIWNSSFLGKNKRELGYWEGNINRMCDWYNGTGDYYFPHPKDDEKEKQFDNKTNAILTYTSIWLKSASYLKNLNLESGHFSGKSIADIGSGPLPSLLVFENCEKRYCIDHLNESYKELGYPHDHYKGEVDFLSVKSEEIPLDSNSLDAIVSVNALDHVDDFEKTAQEMLRVLKPGGELHMTINCHQSVTSTETQALSKEFVLDCFSSIEGFEVVSSEKGAYGFNDGETVLFSNRKTESMSKVS